MPRVHLVTHVSILGPQFWCELFVCQEEVINWRHLPEFGLHGMKRRGGGHAVWGIGHSLSMTPLNRCSNSFVLLYYLLENFLKRSNVQTNWHRNVSFLSRSWVEVPFPCPYAILIELTYIFCLSAPLTKTGFAFSANFSRISSRFLHLLTLLETFWLEGTW